MADSEAWLALGIVPVAAIRQLVPVFYAYGDTRTPVLGTTVHLIVFLALAWWLRASLGHVGIAAAFSGANGVQLLVMWALLRRRLPALRLREIVLSAGRTAIACSGAALTAWVASDWTRVPPNANGWQRLVPAAASSTIFGVSFLALAWLTRSDELRQLLAGLQRRLAPGRRSA